LNGDRHFAILSEQFETRFCVLVFVLWSKKVLIHVGFQSRGGSLIVSDLRNPENDPFGVQVGKLV
jgi:hypothetical protein